MPRKNIYVRVDDAEKFGKITDFPQWLHNNLQNGPQSRDELLEIALKTIEHQQRQITRLQKKINLVNA